MKGVYCLLILLLAGATLRAQYVYTINADSVKITNHCDTAELIIENHTQTVPGFLYNKGRGRTEFRKVLQKINDTLYLFGPDSLKLPPGITLPATQIAFGSSVNTITSTSSFTYDDAGKILTLGPGHLTTGGSNIIFSYNLPVAPTGAGNVAVGMHGLFATLTSGAQNIAIGDYTMTGVTSGTGNTAVGPGALQRLTTGNRNVGLGYQALQWLTTQNYNTAVGPGVFNNAIVGTGNVNIGGNPFTYFSIPDTIGDNNIFIGYKANDLNSTGNSNIVIGDSSYTSHSNNSTLIGTGMNTSLSNIVGIGRIDQNVIIGATAVTANDGKRLQVIGSESISDKLFFPLSDNTGKSAIYKGSDVFISSYNGNISSPDRYDNSVYIGRQSGNFTNSSIGANTGIGYQVMSGITNAYNNNGIGIWTLKYLTTGFNNTADGPYALKNLTTGIENTALGTAALTTLVSGGQNTALGTYAGSSDTGSLNVFIGFKAGYDETGSNKLYIANSATHTPLIYGDFSTSVLTINGQASVTGKTYLGGNTNPSATLHLSAGTAAAGTAPIKLTAGTVLATPEDGSIEYDGTDLFLTQSSTRYKLSKTLAGQLTTSFGGAAVSAGNTVTTSISVPGAQPGDVVAVSANTGAVNPPSIIITAYVTTANSVTLQAYNSSGSTIALASDTYKVRVIR